MAGLMLDAKTTALVIIDLQRGIASRTTAPHAAGDVVKRAAELAAAFRGKGGTVVYVHVDLVNFQTLTVDSPSRDPNAPVPPAEAMEIVPEAGIQEGDVVVMKRFWGAFEKTDLEEQLRGRGVSTIVLAGISTNLGVESTARTAAGLGFQVVLAEDAMAAQSAETHLFAVRNIFPRLGRVRSAGEIAAALS